MSIFAAIPVKTLLESKTRLSKVLKPEECRTLTLAMLEDVLKAVIQSSKVRSVALVSSDPKVQDFASNFGVIHILEKKRGLNQAIDQAVIWCIKNDAESILILPADIPLIRPSDVRKIINLCSDEMCIAIAPSQRGGTSALLQRPPNLIKPSFGPNSFSRHLAQASKKKITAKVFYSKRLIMDIDFPEDLEKLLEIEAQTMSHRFLKQIGLDARLKKYLKDR